jgi:hypothetical protein
VCEELHHKVRHETSKLQHESLVAREIVECRLLGSNKFVDHIGDYTWILLEGTREMDVSTVRNKEKHQIMHRISSQSLPYVCHWLATVSSVQVCYPPQRKAQWSWQALGGTPRRYTDCGWIQAPRDKSVRTVRRWNEPKVC